MTFPTKTRLTLLRQVDDRLVILDPTSGESYVGTREGGRTKVTSRITELQACGWVWRVEDGIVWRLTDHGRKVLDGAA